MILDVNFRAHNSMMILNMWNLW